MDDGSFNSPQKVFIREHWDKPLLKFLTKRVNDKLLYLGLPSPKAEDILEWIEYIKTVIAFQCREYGKESEEGQERKAIEDLEALLNQLEREEKIDNFVVFDGYLEEVILRGYDNSPKRIDFNLNDLITLYNLDFCNKITSPITFLNKEGDEESAYKFDAINKLLQIQKKLSSASNKFVLFLTVHCSYHEAEIQDFIGHPPTNEIGEYIKKYKALKGHEQNARIVRLFFSYYIKQHFEAFGFVPKILPSLYYQGLGDTALLHFTVFGIDPLKKPAGRVPTYQSLTEVLNQKFIAIDNAKFINKADICDGEEDVELNPVKLFSESETFTKMWV